MGDWYDKPRTVRGRRGVQGIPVPQLRTHERYDGTAVRGEVSIARHDSSARAAYPLSSCPERRPERSLTHASTRPIPADSRLTRGILITGGSAGVVCLSRRLVNVSGASSRGPSCRDDGVE